MNKLPNRYLITGDDPFNQKAFLQRLHEQLSKGFTLIQLRAKTLSHAAYLDLATAALTVSKPFPAKIILNTDVETIKLLDADGIHLSHHALLNLPARPLAQDKLIGASCHNAEGLRHAEHIGIDFVTLSPVLATKTHPEVEPLGWENFAALARKTTIPIYALGGMTESHLPLAIKQGAHGIAAIRAFWESP